MAHYCYFCGERCWPNVVVRDRKGQVVGYECSLCRKKRKQPQRLARLKAGLRKDDLL